MNEEALNDSFNLFASQGYNGSIEDYKELMLSNADARADSYNLFTSEGYNGTDTDFNDLIGISGKVTLADEELGKTNDSANVDPTAESDTTGSESEKPLSALQSIKNSFLKAGERLGDVTEFWGADEGMGSALDIATNSTYSLFVGQKNIDDFVEKYGEDSFLTAGLGTKETLEAIEKYKKEQEESSFKTKQITESIKKGDITGAGAGIVEAVINGVSSVAYFLGTAGAGIYAENVAENYINYNEQKAKNLGISMPELIKQGKADNLAPVGLGALSVALERIGFGKMAKVAGGKDIVKNISGKLIYNKAARNVANVLAAGGTEFATEILQHATDKVNEEIGRTAGTENETEVLSSIGNAIFSQEGLEAGLQGFFGGSGMAGAGRSLKALNTIRTTVDGDLVNDKIEELSKKRVKLNAETDAVVKEGIQLEINDIEQTIADSIVKGNIIYDSLTDEQLSEIESLTELADAAAYKITELNKKLRFKDIDQAAYDVSVQGFTKQYEQARQGLIDMNLEKNIEFAKKEAEARGLKFKVYETTKALQQAMNRLKTSKENKQKFKDNKGNVHGFAIGDQIFINKEVSSKLGAINVGAHEFLHPLFNKLVGDVKTQGKYVRQFKRAMTSSQRRFMDKEMRNRGYTSPVRYNTEYINVFSDALRKKRINYDKTVFEKVGGAVLGILKPKGYSNASFDSGRDVYNFIKEYDKSIEEGKLTKAAKAAIGDVDLTGVKLEGVDMQESQEILDLTDALDAAEDAYAADPNNPTLEKNVELAEKALDEAEERAISGAPAVKPAVTKPKEEKKKAVKKEPKPVRTTNLDPQTAQDKKIMDAYNEGMKDTKRTSFTSSNPLPAKVENKLIPLFEGYINTLVKQKFKQYQSEALEFQDALSILRVEAVNALRTFNPARNQNLSGYVRRLIALRQPKMFEKANKEFTSSLDDVNVAGDAGVIRSFANEEMVAPDNLIKASKVISSKVKDSLVSMLKKWADQNNIDFDLFRFGDVDANATVIVDGKKVTILHELLKELFPDVNPEKFLDSSTMFTGPEASIVLEKLAANNQELIELFINLLPRGAVMPKGKNKAIVKDDNYGKSTKLDKSILTTFYNKGDVSERFTKDAGLIPFTLKDNVRYSDVHKAFGMDSSGNKLNYKRSGKGSAGPVLASAYKMLGRLIMNEIIRTDLGLTAEQKMNVGAGKSDLQFSKNASVLEALNVKGTENFRNIFVHQREKYRKAGQDLLIELAFRFTPEEVRDYILPLISDVDGSNYKNDAKLLFENKTDFFRKLKEYRKSKFGDYKPRQQRISVEGGAELKLAKVTSEYYQGASFIENIKAFVGNIKDRQTFAKEQQKGLLKIVKTLSEILDETSSKKVGFDGKSFENISLGIFAYFNYLNTKNKNGILRTSAVPTHMAIIPRLLGFKDTPVKYIYEHTQTASDTSGELMQLVFNKFAKNQKFGKNPNIEKEFKEIMDGYTIALIPKIYDTLLNTIAKENGDREGTKTRKDYIKKLLKPGKDGIPTRYKIPAFEKLLEEYGLEYLQDILTPIDQANYDAIVKGREAQFSINRVEVTETLNRANNNANKINAKPKGISVWDFDDTLAKTKSNVLYTMPDGTKGKLNAEEFAKKGDQMLEEGVEFDFSEFSKVVNGSKGPFFEKAMARNKKFGNKNVFILTARPANSANAIHEFLKGIGLDIPLVNITGLANSSPQAKADWVVGKAAEGYNDFYFADDATQNVEAVDKALKKLPVKSKAELAVIKKSDIQFSMNTKYPAKWRGLRDIDGLENNTEMVTHGLLTVGDMPIYLYIEDGAAPGSEALNFDFPEGTLDIGFDLESSFRGLVPKENAFKIFGAVINAMTEKIKTYGSEVNAITFSGFGNSRKKLYDLMAKRYAAELGWKYKMSSVTSSSLGNAVTGFYVIYRPDSKPAFNEQSTEVKEVLKVIDIKSPQRSSLQFSKSMNSEFNKMIEKKSGIDARGTISKYKAAVMGRKKGRFEFFIPPGAEDFEGLLYKLLDKGKVGEQQKEWFKRTLFDPFARGINEFDTYKLQVAGAVRQLKKSLKDIPKELGKRDPKTDFKYEDAVRVYLWKLNGHEIKNISAADIKALVDIVNNSPNLKRFARQLNKIMGGYPAPQDSWLAGTVTTDAINMVNTIKRKEFLQTWQQNADIIFSEDNINKLEAMFGENYVEALKDSLYRMKSGRNRPSGANKLTNKFMNWVNDSVATIMFFNTRSALLQTLSTVNFINWGDNNPINAAKAFSNPKQFWSDFAMLFNSDFLKSRRTGLKNDVNADEIANAAATQTNKAKAALAVLLKAGFLPTQIADSFAIAMGGASFYRNRVNTYMQKGEGKPGMGRLAAEEQAFLDFQEIAEATQQSSRPDRVSQQQASPLGRIILAFANTPMQYMRLTKKAFLDLKNGRGSAKENITKILYYAAIQNVIFSSLQAALFATLFDDEEDEETKKKGVRVANTMLDSMLRGLGIYGAVASTAKNILLEIDKQSEKDRPDYSEAAVKALDLSPPISSKIRKGRSAGRAFSYKNTREKMVGFGLDNPAYYAVGQIASATANIPLDRAIGKANHVRLAFAQETKFWQSISLLLGFSEWDLNMMEKDKKKTKFGEKTKWKTRKFKKRKLK